MNLFRYIIFALSVALIFSVGSSSATIHSHPEISVADDRTLSLRETGSQIVMETIEDAIRQGGLALFDGKFQIDSSLNWVFGERIEGEVDVVVPLWSGDGHVVFAQPGLALWTGIADEDRIDTNLGVVYRTNLLNTLTGIDVISGVSVFYDNNFRRGHSRVSIGMDAQHREFRGAFNYYEPLSDDKRGRAGYIEDAIRGMDARFAFQRDIMRLSANLGYWRYEGDGRSKSEWELSYGLDASVRIVDGVFIEGGYEKHDDDASIGERLNLGVAFKFSLPDFKGRSYEDVSMSSDLYQIVDREKRILYEERESDGIILSASGEGNTRNVSVQLRRAATEDIVLNFIGSGSATYNDDWTISVGGTDCDTVMGTDCQITIMAGETSPSDEVIITFQEPARGEPAEDIILSVEVASGGGANLLPGNPLVVRIPEGEPLPTVSLNYSGSRTIDGNSIVRQTIELSEALSDSITVTLTASGTADYDSDLENGTWNLAHAAVAEGTTPADAFPFSDADFCSNTAITGAGCEIIISAGQTIVDLAMNSKVLTSGETIELILGIGSASTSFVTLVSSPRVDFVIEAPPLPTVTMSATNTTIMEGLQRIITFTLSEAVSDDVTLNLIADTSSTAQYGSSNDWVLNDGSGACTSAIGTSCQITIDADDTTAMTRILVLDNMAGEEDETAIVRVMVDSRSRHLVQEGSPLRLTFTIPADPPLPAVSISATSASIAEGGSATLTATLSETVTEPVVINLLEGGAADYGTGMDWHLNNGSDCSTATGTSCQITITAGQTTATATVNVNTDSTVESTPETFTVSIDIASPDSTVVVEGSPSMLTFTIPANDQPSTLGFELSEVSTPETITMNTQSVVRLRGELKDASGTRITTLPVNLPFRLTVTGNDDNDVELPAGGDLELGASSVTFNRNGFISPFVSVTINDDATPEEDETFTVTLHKRGNFPDGWDIDADNNSVDIIILANDQPTLPTVSLNYSGSTTISEGVQIDDRMMIQLSEALTQDVTFNLTVESDDMIVLDGASGDFVIQYQNSSGTRTQCGDLMENSQTLVRIGGDLCEPRIRAGSTSIALSIITIADGSHTDTTAETFTLSVSIPSASASLVELGSPSSLTFTIPAEPTSTLGFAETGRTVDETSRTIAIRGVVKDASGMKLSSIPVTLPYTLSITNNDDGDINIDTGSGLQLTPTGTTNFNSDNEFAMHSFTTRDDTTPEPQEEFVVTLGEGPNFPSGWIIDPNANTFTITVNANDQPSTLGFAETGRTTDETRAGRLTILGVIKDASGMKLSSLPVSLPITLSISNNDDPDIEIDTAPGHELSPSGVVFNSDNDFTIQSVQIIDDTTPEPQEEFVVTLGEGPNFPSGWIIDPNANTFTITINANDQPVTLMPAKTSIEEGTSTTITLSLNQALASDAVFNLTSGGGATYGTTDDWNLSVNETDCNMASGTNCQVTISKGNTSAEVTVRANLDLDTESPNETFTVTVAAASGSEGLVTIDSSSTPLSFSIQDEPPPAVSLNYGETDTTFQRGTYPRFTVDLSKALTAPVTLDITGSGTGGTYSASGGWFLYYRVAPAGETSYVGSLVNFASGSRTCRSVANAGDCQITVPEGSTIVDIQLFVSRRNTAGGFFSGGTITVSLGIPTASENLVVLGTPSTHTLTLQ